MICFRSIHCCPLYSIRSSLALLSPLVNNSWVVFLRRQRDSRKDGGLYARRVGFYHSVNDRDLISRSVGSVYCSAQMHTSHPHVHLVHGDIANLIRRVRGIGEEQYISTVESGLHGSTACERAMKRHKIASIAYDKTTTIGDSELVTRHNAFHIIKPEATMDSRLSTWNRSCALVATT